MNSLYHKIAVASVCTALSFALGTNQEAKAATFTLTGTGFGVENDSYRNVGERVFDSEDYISVQKVGNFFSSPPTPEKRAFYEFNIGNLSLAPNTIISRASFEITLRDVNPIYIYLYLDLLGYVGNGRPDLSDFNAGERLDYKNVVIDPFTYPRRTLNTLNFNVTEFVNKRVSNGDTFAGFGIHILNYSLNYGTAPVGSVSNLTIETADVAEPVPEPTTIFGSALALGVGGWLKRKKPTPQNKAKSQA